jgi:capsid protein
MRRRIHALYSNFGLARRIVRGKAQLCGFLTPQPSTRDDEWNEAVFDNFQARAGSPYIYDRKGELDFFSGQVAVNTTRAKDGRLLSVLTEGVGAGAQVAFYEAHQMAGAPAGRENGWEQGVLLDKFDRHLAYALTGPKNPNKVTVVRSRDCIYHRNWDAMGRIHGLSTLAPAAADMQDLVEIDSSTKHQIKVASELGIVVETDTGPAIQLGNGAMLGAAGFKEVTVRESVAAPDGSVTDAEVTRRVSTEKVLQQGGIPNLKPGQKVKVVMDDRPGPNREAFYQRIVDRLMFGADLPPAALYYLTDLTGPGVRYTMAQIERWVTLEHRRQAWECQRFYLYHVAKEIAAGRLPQGPPGWWNNVLWLGLPSMTIDSGREGNLTITNLESGLTTWGDEWAAKGQFGKRKLRERIREFAWAKSETAAAAAEFGVDVQLGEVMPKFR